MEKKYYKLGNMILTDGDRFEIQMEKPGENPHNPSGIGVETFYAKNYINLEEVPAPATKINTKV